MIELDIRKKLRGAQGVLPLEAKFSLAEGEFAVLFGESGAGKTTLLRCLAGLAQPDGGYIRADGVTWFGQGASLPAQQRRVGYMFQDYALFPNMSVRGNIEFALRRGAARARAAELIEMMGLAELQDRTPNTLSGGQQQRVALARALAAEPRLLLLDEPFSALDQETRLRLQDEVLRLQRRYGLTTLMVSHDVGEAWRLARRVLVLEGGRIVHEGPPAAVFGAEQAGGRFGFAGEVLAIEPAGVVYAVTLLVGNQIVRVVASASEAQRLRPGARVTLLSKAFNPMLVPVSRASSELFITEK